MKDALVDSASIIEGRVVDVQFTYDAIEGPRTVTTFADVRTHAGEDLGKQVQVSTLGGPLPDGRTLWIPELSQFRKGSRYVVFLTGSDWFYSPVIADYAFRVETIGGRELLVTQSGHPVIGVSASSIESAHASVDAPMSEIKTRFDQRTLAPDAASRADGSLSKATFVSFLKTLARTNGPHGTFKRSIAAGRSWNVTSTEPDPQTATNGARP